MKFRKMSYFFADYAYAAKMVCLSTEAHDSEWPRLMLCFGQLVPKSSRQGIRFETAPTIYFQNIRPILKRFIYCK